MGTWKGTLKQFRGISCTRLEKQARVQQGMRRFAGRPAADEVHLVGEQQFCGEACGGGGAPGWGAAVLVTAVLLGGRVASFGEGCEVDSALGSSKCAGELRLRGCRRGCNGCLSRVY